MSDLRRKTLLGLGWRTAAQVSSQVLQLGLLVILARLLSAREFGLMGMIYVFTGFAQSLADLGLAAAIIQKQNVSDRHLNSVFWVNIAIGAFLTALFVATAPLVATFYDEPMLISLVSVVACNFLLASFNVVQDALLDKSLNFRRRFWIETISLSTSGVVALTLVLAGAGVWSLVGQLTSATAARAIVMWSLSSWRPKLIFEWSAIKDLAHFSSHLFGSKILWYWGQTLDKLIVGRLFGSAALGIYNFAFRLMQLPLNQINEITTAVMFPALSKVQDVESVRRIYLRATRMLALVNFPLMIGLLVVAEPAILAVFGDKWREAIIILQILTVAGAVAPIGNSTGWLLQARGRTDIQFWLSIYSIVIRTIGIIVAIRWGMVGMAIAYVVAGCFFIWFPSWAIAWRLIGLRLGEMMANLAGPIGCAISMGIAVHLLDTWLLGDLFVWVRFVAAVLCGAIVYGLLVRIFRLKAMAECAQAALELGGQRFRFVRWFAPGVT